jgi:hypothetical protein
VTDREEHGKRDIDAEGAKRLLEKLRHRERWDEHKIGLKTGAGEWPLIDAECAFMDLQDMQKDRPEEFAALVALVKPRGVTRLPDAPAAQALAKLREAKIVLPDGSVDSLFAATLDGAYTETEEGVILRNPIQYPSREMFAERERLIGLGVPASFGGRGDAGGGRSR